ncbi:MAG: cysteine--tRNA ligase [Patescibacteria group bacterium]|nr:cysteine--tRNA ligase [Patescibacteria group bacterium]MCL5261740.1 cysteine--tRNA ligase [Patescibacteria group bacterium]
MKIFNTLRRRIEEFKPIKKGFVGLYTCGPTVYNFSHIGNLRTYIFEDLLRRTLEWGGFKVKQVMNITDVDDKIIKKAVEESKIIAEITVPYTKAFLEDLKDLNIEKAAVYPRATRHVKDMLRLVASLMAKGFAYQGKDKSVYFEIAKFPDYGKLADLDKVALQAGSRIEADEYNKEEARDFVLWKAMKPGEPSWPSRFGLGRPGWHIECSAMSMHYLGSHFDIHTGGVDNIFPHHENEIAQSEAATGKTFVNYWMHSEHLMVDGQKMSKSLNNFYTLRDIKNRGFDPLAFRYATLTNHYRSKMNFTWEALEASQNALNNLRFEIAKLRMSSAKAPRHPSETETKLVKSFKEAVENDLNVPEALGIAWQAVKEKNLNSKRKLRLLLDFDKIFGLGLANIKKPVIPRKIKAIVKKRELLRAHQQFIQSDVLRNKIEALGYKLEDTEEGPIITKK